MNRRDVLRVGLLAGAQALLNPLLGFDPRQRLLGETIDRAPAPGGSLPPPGAIDLVRQAVSERAAELVRNTTVIDMLSLLTLDWPQLYAWQSEPSRFGPAQLELLRASGISVFHPAVDPSAADAHAAAQRWMNGWNHLLAGHPEMLLRIDGTGDLLRVKGENRVGILLGFQNSSHFRTPADVAAFYALGQRVSQLTYNERNRLGSGCGDPAGGLSNFGGEIIDAMNRQGMAIDISHCGERTSLDALAASRKPVLITHSNCRALVHHPRCKSDAVIRAMAAKGGVIGISVLPMMLAAGRRPTLSDVLDQFDHVAHLVGPEHAGLGSDTDVDAIDPHTHRTRSGYAVSGMRHVDRVFELTDGLIRRGYGEDAISGFLGGNFQRALTAIWGG